MEAPRPEPAPSARLDSAVLVARWATGLLGLALLIDAGNFAQVILRLATSDAWLRLDLPLPLSAYCAKAALMAACGGGLAAFALRWRRWGGAAALAALVLVGSLAALQLVTTIASPRFHWLAWPTAAGLAALFVKESTRGRPQDHSAPRHALAALALALGPLALLAWLPGGDDQANELQASLAVAACAVAAAMAVRVPPALPAAPARRRPVYLALALTPVVWWLESRLVEWAFTPTGWDAICGQYDRSLASLTPAERWLALAFLAPVFEELLYRRMLFPWLAAFAGLRWGAVLQAVAFAAVHHEPAFMPFIFLMGLALAWLYWRGGLLASIAAHALWNGLCAWDFQPGAA